jgi:hypothetical protein
MSDERTYIKVHDGIEDHPKIVTLSDRSFRILVTTWGWCSRHKTNGRVPDAVWKKRASVKVRGELEAAGLVEQRDGFVLMHDYLKHQRSAELIDEIREIKQRAGRMGNHKRWHVEQGIVDPACEFCVDDGSQEVSQVRSQTDRTGISGSDRKTSPETETETETDKEEPSLRSGTRKRGARIPDDFAVTPEMVTWAGDRVPRVDGRLETEKFINYWQAATGKGSTKRDWVATWRNWMLSANERLPAGRASPVNGYHSQTDANIEAFLKKKTGEPPALQLLEGGTT